MNKFTCFLAKVLAVAMKVLTPVAEACATGAKKACAFAMKLWGRRGEAKDTAVAAVNKARSLWKKQPGMKKRSIKIAAGAVCMLLMVSVIAVAATFSEVPVEPIDNVCSSCQGSGKCSSCGGTHNCKYCGGTGDCDYCYGLGECDECFGEGTRDCMSCNFGNCQYCNYGYRYYGGEERRCTICNGTGYHDRCNGTGQLTCHYCDGSGVCFACKGAETCHACDGDGDCTSCKNNGKCNACKGSGKKR